MAYVAGGRRPRRRARDHRRVLDAGRPGRGERRGTARGRRGAPGAPGDQSREERGGEDADLACGGHQRYSAIRCWKPTATPASRRMVSTTIAALSPPSAPAARAALRSNAELVSVMVLPKAASTRLKMLAVLPVSASMASFTASP